MRRLLCWLLLGLIYGIPAKSQVILSGNESYGLDGQVYAYKENGGVINPDTAFALYKNHQFSPVACKSNYLNLGYTDKVYWLAFTVKYLDTTKAYEAGIANAGLYHLEYYLFNGNGQMIYKYGPTGKRYPFASRCVVSRHYYFPIVKKSADSVFVIMFRADLRGYDFYAPLRLVSKQYQEEAEQKQLNLYLFAEGVYACILLFALVAFILVQQQVYLFYFLYVLSYALLFFADGDWDFGYLYPCCPAWAIISPGMYSSFVIFFMLLFSNAFLQLKSSHKKLHRAANLFVGFIGIFLLLIPLAYSYNNHWQILRKPIYFYGVFCIVGSWILQLYVIVVRIRDKFKPAYILGTANSFVLLATLFFILHSLNILSITKLPQNYMLLAFAIEIIILGFALMYQFNTYRINNLKLAESISRQQLEFSNQLIQTQEAERKRIAEDLHDELGSNLAALKLRLQKTNLPQEQLQDILNVVDTASANTRTIAHNLMPPQFEQTHFESLLRNHYTMLSNESNILFIFHCSGYAAYFSKANELLIYRILIEITNNVLKHSEATECTIQLIYYAEKLNITVEDNGKGFIENNSGGIGLKNIHSRVEFMGGTMQMDSSNKGTSVIIDLPYKNNLQNE